MYRLDVASFLSKYLLTFSGSQGCRGGPSLAPSDAQRHVEPERSNGLLNKRKNVNGSFKSVNGILKSVNGSLNNVNGPVLLLLLRRGQLVSCLLCWRSGWVLRFQSQTGPGATRARFAWTPRVGGLLLRGGGLATQSSGKTRRRVRSGILLKA